MKKYIFILIIIIIAVGGFIMKNINDKNEQAEEIKIAQERMEKFIKANYEGIHNVTFKDKYEIDPMGGIEVFGYYNDVTSNKFDGIYDKANDKIMGHTIDAVRKKECRDKDCDY
ncbi:MULTISPECIES: DUF1433 domain-containing protein [Bacillus amyloliquefaciens group]|nr:MULTISPECIES: DUF1433 domain-containing protein [Bacillus amyloliquefaciens group]KJD58753.1 hypothetical protein UZ38_06885 [Bacillus amyloliquefaciens]KJR68171.1 hypothetical protein BAGR45_17075 [Bacillus velezensis]PLT51355.1 hypothetical protein BVY13_02725 [Bacillus amyloliquefaciens]WHM01473.1 DUF1433 domain-containing protein [Bacillus velezensis]